MREICRTAAALVMAAVCVTSCGDRLFAMERQYAYFDTMSVASACMAVGETALRVAGYTISDVDTARLIVGKRGGATGEWFCFAPDEAAIEVSSPDSDETDRLAADLLRARDPAAKPFPLASVLPDDGNGPIEASIAIHPIHADENSCLAVSYDVLEHRSAMTVNADDVRHVLVGRNQFSAAEVSCWPHFLAINVVAGKKSEADAQLHLIESRYPGGLQPAL